MVAVTLSLENEIFRSYLFYSCILLLKMMSMSILTGLSRQKLKIFSNDEDAVLFKGKVGLDERVERPRRAHLNDLENIPLFFVGAPIYILTGPTPFVAKSLFFTYTAARVVYTCIYGIIPTPQPARGIIWWIGYSITGYMAFTGLFHFM